MSMRYKGGFLTNNPPSTSGTAYTGVASGMWTLQEAMDAVKANLWPKAQGAPDAPTIGTATLGLANHGIASVTFTAPVDTGGTDITSYIATSSPGGYTATSASSPITFSDLPGVIPGESATPYTYTFTVRAINVSGTGQASNSSNAIAPDLTYGQAYGGGYFAGFISAAGNGIASHRLIVSDKSVGDSAGFQWGTSSTTTGVVSMLTGSTNTTSLVSLGTAYQAASFCENLSAGGYTDWYLPAKNELEICYYNLKPMSTQNTNEFGSGTNANAVSPQAINAPYVMFSTTNPSLTTSLKFRYSAAQQEFQSNNYYTSTEKDANNAYYHGFVNGLQYWNGKGNTGYPVRAIRKVAI